MSDPGIVLRPASTVVVLRPAAGGDAEVLLTHRPATMVFGPGLHVFPGGAVEPHEGSDAGLARRSVLDAEAAARAWAGDLAPGPALAHAVAAIRELWEEVGVLLAVHADGSPVDPWTVAAAANAAADGDTIDALVERLDLRLATDRLVPLSHWVTPPTADTTRRYDTRFYVADLPEGGEIAIDAREVVAHEWLAPAEALARYADRRLDLWPPTSSTLRQLLGAGGAEDVRRRLSPVSVAPAPVVTAVADGVVRVRLGSGGGIPGAVVDAWLVGRRRVVVVDPGDPTGEGLDAVLGAAAAAGLEVAAVVATSVAPDHVAGAVGLALVAGVPLRASALATATIGEPCVGLGDGDWIRDGDVALQARLVPGDPDGSLVLVAPELDVVLSGDLHATDPHGMAHGDARGRTNAWLDRIPGRRLPAHED